MLDIEFCIDCQAFRKPEDVKRMKRAKAASRSKGKKISRMLSVAQEILILKRIIS
jgi:hypothetical protein